jgi:hypothetical protein
MLSTDSVRLISFRLPDPTSAARAEAFIQSEMNVIEAAGNENISSARIGGMDGQF